MTNIKSEFIIDRNAKNSQAKRYVLPVAYLQARAGIIGPEYKYSKFIINYNNK